jgi:hypothetical protein
MRLSVLLLACSLALAAQSPVRWQPWGGEAFAKARREGRPVLVDAEATWCHWCHVMEARTYGDPEVAALVNGSFVAIKADIDQHPDAQELYADIGWPGTTLYAPDGTVLWRHRGFIPKEDFLPVLRRVAGGDRSPWKEEDTPLSKPEVGDALAWARRRLDGTFDADLGGWGTQKYPIAMDLEELFRRASEGDAAARFRALYTLSQQRHITDPIWGGIFQYSAGPDWHDVHFEKLATLQAGYLENLAEARRATGDADWRRDADRVLAFLRRFMEAKGGGFYATVDADLGGHGAPRPRMLGKDYYALGDAARLKAGLPRTDRHRYAQVQGLLIAALAQYGPKEISEARHALDYVEAHLREGEGYLHAEDRPGAFYLQDQAAMLKGLLALFEATQDEALLRRAEALAAFIKAHFGDGMGLYLARAGGEASLPVAQRRPVDDNLLLARAFLRLEAFTGQGTWRERAKEVADRLCTPPTLEAQGRWLGDAILLLAELKEEAPHLVVVGDPRDPRTRALWEAAREAWLPGLARIQHDPRRGEPVNPELTFPVLKEPAAFLCGKGTCSKPLRTAEDLDAELRRRRP